MLKTEGLEFVGAGLLNVIYFFLILASFLQATDTNYLHAMKPVWLCVNENSLRVSCMTSFWVVVQQDPPIKPCIHSVFSPSFYSRWLLKGFKNS